MHTTDTLPTLESLVIARKCRKGDPVATTASGAFWLAAEPIVTRRCGGDGIGQSAPDITITMELRHYRDDHVAIMLKSAAWHQNGSRDDVAKPIPAMLTARTVEDVIQVLRGTKISGEHALSGLRIDAITDALLALGMPLALPSPDDVSAA